MALFEITKDNFQQEVLESDKPVLVKFWAPWCGYCRRLEPAIQRLSEELEGTVRFAGANTDETPELAQEYSIEVIPTLILFQKGKASAPLINPPSQDAIKQWLKEQGAL